MTITDRQAVAKSVLSAASVRDRCHQVLAARDQLSHFRVNLDRLDATADYVVETIRENYPDLRIPFHARWRHFTFAGVDRWSELARNLKVTREEKARIQFDLAITSVLLDAGAGPAWRFLGSQTGQTFNRSEGLALASLEAFVDGLFSSDMSRPLQADAVGLKGMSSAHLGGAFQVTPNNPLEGLEGRVALMTALGAALHNKIDYFSGSLPRVGNLFDWIAHNHGDGIAAPELLSVVLDVFGGIWPGRLSIDGVNLGDTWKHPAIVTNDETTGLVPFHKLSQWLTYSLIEPLQDAGIPVRNIDGLTGLAEYRNGGLFVDLGVLELIDADAGKQPHAPGAPIIVEWRALTVALLDKVAALVREKLGAAGEALPLASILEGGTWSAGRRIAKEVRADATPPLRIKSDGSVF